MIRIASSLGVCGGDPCIAGTRIPVWLLVAARRAGATDAQLLADYPSIKAADLQAAWHYAADHAVEIDHQIAENESA